MKKKFLSYAMAGALTVGALAGVGTTEAFAHAGSKSQGQMVQQLDADTQAKVEAIMKDAETKLAALGVTMPKKEAPFANLDAATQTKVQQLMAQHKAGTLAQADFEAQLKELGVTLPQKGKKGEQGKQNPFANLDADKKAEAQAIMADVKAQLDELGVKAPGPHNGKGKGFGKGKYNN